MLKMRIGLSYCISKIKYIYENRPREIAKQTVCSRL